MTSQTRILPSDAALLAVAQSSPALLPVLRVTARTADGKRFARVVVLCECGAERECASQDLFQVRGCYSCQSRMSRKARKTRTKTRVASLRTRIAELTALLATAGQPDAGTDETETPEDETETTESQDSSEE